MAEPVLFQVERPEARDRTSAILRPILVVPHAMVVGGPFVGFGVGNFRSGAFGLLAFTFAVLDWFAILFRGRSLEGLQPLKRTYLRWRARVLAYGCFLRDEYPPFGEGEYPARLVLPDEPATRNVASVALRPIVLIPHLVVMAFLLIAEVAVAIVAWFSLTFTGRMGEGLWRFGRDTMAYLLRVEAYGLLLHDEYPPFRFAEPEPGNLPTTDAPAAA